MMGPFVHEIDPIIGKIGDFYFWWYGLSYTLGFLGVFLWIRRNRARLAMTDQEMYDLAIFLAAGVLMGGRLVEVIFYEWAYYGKHIWHIPAVWLGGMSTHGILLGAIIGISLFSRLNHRSFLETADMLVIAGAYIMGVGRIGNFIDGQIVGSITDAWWGVQFPDLEGYRHPVVLYDGIKNLLLIPFLLLIRRTDPPRGVMTAHFILWYGFLRIFVDFFREYRTDFFGLPPGQEFNILMTLIGVSMLFLFYRNRRSRTSTIYSPFREKVPGDARENGLWGRRIIFVLFLALPMIIPSDWTQDIPSRYGKRHPGIEYSTIYPKINEPQQAD
jgi:phosphatidylglycerol:prolipoprotein diacylglycerol transferase